MKECFRIQGYIAIPVIIAYSKRYLTNATPSLCLVIYFLTKHGWIKDALIREGMLHIFRSAY